MSTARVGREKQRWDGDIRLVCGCVPFRVNNNQIEILLVRSQKKDQWIFPKGGWENDETAEEAALRECHEEAGVVGEIVAPLFAADIFSRQRVPVRLHAFLMKVTQQLDVYAEQGERSRQWFPLHEAQNMITREEMLMMLRTASESDFFSKFLSESNQS
eukprot:TRINITY_DN9792_c0_g1_i3.p1 TRINITY_DN9792_c0_g1~~TRINITY_DN9792_c0_g1_i3.p1  ORF type:complete len:159 (+),score=28.69 TRINITY_DN9792_c0_g1_i3:92-568(+)